MTQRVKECIHPEKDNCRGCSHSYNPALYDGGCKLHYGAETAATGRTGQRSNKESEE